MVQRRKRQSILIYFISTSVVLLLIVVIFNSLAIKEQFDRYRQAHRASALLEVCNSLFQAVRHYGFERGRVNVVLNFQGPMEQVQESIDFLRAHRNAGDEGLTAALDRLGTFKETHDFAVAERIGRRMELISRFRTDYEEQIAVPFAQRDSRLDDDWFNAMSEQIGDINFLLFAIMQKSEWPYRQRHLVEIFYVLSQLRDNAGPVVSYLKAASFNWDSLTAQRIGEIGERRKATEGYLVKLEFLLNRQVEKKLYQQTTDFVRFYLDEFYPLADNYITVVTRGSERVRLDGNYLAMGVETLEKLNYISDSLGDRYRLINSKVMDETSVNLLVGILASLLTISLICYSLYFAYKLIYKRIINAYSVIYELSRGNTSVSVVPSSYDDEITEIENGLELFRENLQQLNQANVTLNDEMIQRIRSEEKMRRLFDERGVLLKEIHHRVKNNLQIITSMISLQKRTESDPRVVSSLAESQRRIANIAAAHQFIYEYGDLSAIDSQEFFDKIMTETVSALERPSADIAIHSDISSFTLGFSKASTCAQILGELLSNAYKHAFPGRETGEIRVRLSRGEKQKIRLIVEDDGVGFDFTQTFNQTLGLRLVQALAQKLHGKLTFTTNGGTRATLCFEENDNES